MIKTLEKPLTIWENCLARLKATRLRLNLTKDQVKSYSHQILRKGIFELETVKEFDTLIDYLVFKTTDIPLSIHPQSIQDYYQLEVHAIESFLSEINKNDLRRLKRWAKPEQIKVAIKSNKISNEQFANIKQWLIELSQETTNVNN